MPDPLQDTTPDRPASRRFGLEGLQLAARALQALRLDPPGLIQAFGGLVIVLITLFSSDDQLSFFGHRFQLQRQWGLLLLLASVATVFGGIGHNSAPLGRDAQLATRSRLRAAHEAAGERNRTAEARERQRESLERLHQGALLSARVQLDPYASNRARLQTFLALIRGQ